MRNGRSWLDAYERHMLPRGQVPTLATNCITAGEESDSEVSAEDERMVPPKGLWYIA